jgi:hypothetical protein
MARLRLIKYLVNDLGLNLAGVELVLALFNRLLKLRLYSESLEGENLQRALELSLGEMFELLGMTYSEL